MLTELLKRKTLNVLGINSGTSTDGLDLALVKVSRTKSGALHITPLLQRSVPYTPSVRKELLQLADSDKVPPEELALLDEALGDLIGKAAGSFIARAKRMKLKTDMIASHGQTIRHHPQRVSRLGRKISATLQIGSPERIAVWSGLPVVSHFRQADTALGGEGAPITTSGVHHALRDSRKSSLLINIGGIANFFYLQKGAAGTVEARDIGPGNVLLDLAARELFSENFDKGGKRAASGAVSLRLLSLISAKGFFGGSQTRSTGREQYSPSSFGRIRKLGDDMELSSEDIMATLVELSAMKIKLAINEIAGSDEQLKEVYLSGGGTKNHQLVKRIRAELPKLKISSIMKLGYHPDFFESVCYAILGYCCLHGLEGIQANVKRKPGARKLSNVLIATPILGRICQPPKLVRPRNLPGNR